LSVEFPIKSSYFANGANLDMLEDEQFAMFHMFTYAEITYVEIMILNELKSDLSNCFGTMTLVIYKSNITYTAIPTSVCKN
jgi:hypothetical protein